MIMMIAVDQKLICASSRTKAFKRKTLQEFQAGVVLVMALAYVDLSREAMALNPNLVRCCDVLVSGLKLLQEKGASNLAPDLQEQINEILEEITPRYVLELLALPLDKEHGAKREKGIRSVHDILWTADKGSASVIGGTL